jgi:hypothetical protein
VDERGCCGSHHGWASGEIVSYSASFCWRADRSPLSSALYRRHERTDWLALSRGSSAARVVGHEPSALAGSRWRPCYAGGRDAPLHRRANLFVPGELTSGCTPCRWMVDRKRLLNEPADRSREGWASV